jgi:hypothetical protein
MHPQETRAGEGVGPIHHVGGMHASARKQRVGPMQHVGGAQMVTHILLGSRDTPTAMGRALTASE